ALPCPTFRPAHQAMRKFFRQRGSRGDSCATVRPLSESPAPSFETRRSSFHAPPCQLFFSVADHFAAQCASINAGEVLFHRRCKQRNVRNLAEMLGDEPNWFFRGHPV